MAQVMEKSRQNYALVLSIGHEVGLDPRQLAWRLLFVVLD